MLVAEMKVVILLLCRRGWRNNRGVKKEYREVNKEARNMLSDRWHSFAALFLPKLIIRHLANDVR